MNKAQLIGRVGRDIEINALNNGGKVGKFSIATSERWKDKQSGEQKETTEWHNVVVFGKLAEIANKFCLKGAMLYVEGSIKTRKWQKDGVDRYSTEIVLNPFAGHIEVLVWAKDKSADDDASYDEAPDNRKARPAVQSQQEREAYDKKNARNDLDDDIPF